MTDFSSHPATQLAVCSWSLEPESSRDLLAKLAAVEISRVQLALSPLRESPELWDDVEILCRRNSLTIISGMVGCLGEDYSTLESIRLTGGIAPDATWADNLKNLWREATLAARMGMELVTFHAGFMPHNKFNSSFEKMLTRLGLVAKIFAARGITLGLETGQETAVELAELLTKLKADNVGVNFDPGNMILYDKGDPVEALRVLAPWLRQVHIKDAIRTKIPGAWGSEVPVGAGEVDWAEFFATLRKLRFKGNLVIEREAGEERVKDICTARDLVLKI